jgi:restriction system protein
MAVWMVRAGRQAVYAPTALEQSLVGIGWHELGDLSGVQSREDLATRMRETYPERSPAQIGSSVGQVWILVGRIQRGDLVVVPISSRSVIAVGRVTGDYQFRPDLPEELQHTRKVDWLATELPRGAFAQDLLHSFGSLLTICQVKRDRAEERILSVVRGERVEPDVAEVAEEDEEAQAALDLEEYARDQIQARIAQRFHGHDLATLVNAVLEAQGYTTEVSPPGPDGGVDIIAGKGPMGFDQPRLVVQVKSGMQTVGVDVLRQLQGVLSTFNAQHGLLVSWGGFRETVYRESRHHFFSIRLWDAGDVVNELLRFYDVVPDGLQAELPLKRIWALVPEE